MNDLIFNSIGWRARDRFIYNLKKYHDIDGHILLRMPKDLLERIIFIDKNDSIYGYYKDFAIDFELLKILDFTGISFDNFNAEGKNFEGTKGIKLNQQTLFKNSLYHANVTDVILVNGYDRSYFDESDTIGIDTFFDSFADWYVNQVHIEDWVDCCFISSLEHLDKKKKQLIKKDK